MPLSTSSGSIWCGQITKGNTTSWTSASWFAEKDKGSSVSMPQAYVLGELKNVSHRILSGRYRAFGADHQFWQRARASKVDWYEAMLYLWQNMHHPSLLGGTLGDLA
jgi:hypothetical protein